MKPHIKFDHDAMSMTKALGITQPAEEVAEMITKVIENWIRKDNSSKHSILSEYLHNELSYEIIIFLATKEIFNKINQTLDSIVENNDVARLN